MREDGGLLLVIRPPITDLRLQNPPLFKRRNTMSAEQLKVAAQNFIEKGLNQKDMSAFEAYFSPDLTDHALPSGLPSGLEGRKMFASALLAAFPDLRVHVEDLVTDGEKIVTRYSVHGTHKGELMG